MTTLKAQLKLHGATPIPSGVWFPWPVKAPSSVCVLTLDLKGVKAEALAADTARRRAATPRKLKIRELCGGRWA